MTNSEDTFLMEDGGDFFPTTRWTLILNRAQQTEIKEMLYKLYWRPLYSLLRRKGFTNDDAKEYTQGFLMDILIGREFIKQVDRKRAKKFRSLLVKSFMNYVYGRLRKNREHSYDDVDAGQYDIPDLDEDKAARAFDYEWATGILQHVLDDVEAQCIKENLGTHWNVFKDRILIPILEGTQPPPLSVICRRYGIESPEKVSNMIVTTKRRFQKALTRSIANYTHSAQEYQDELTDFFMIFSQK